MHVMYNYAISLEIDVKETFLNMNYNKRSYVVESFNLNVSYPLLEFRG